MRTGQQSTARSVRRVAGGSVSTCSVPFSRVVGCGDALLLLQVCKHMWSLLDADQEQPWPDQPLTYYQKYRFYFQEYKPRFHVVSFPRISWGIAAGAEAWHTVLDVQALMAYDA